MPCKDAMIEEVISVRPDQTIGDALTLFEKHKIRTVPVVDEKHALCGLFSFNQVLSSLLPMTFDETDEDGGVRHFKAMDVSLDFLGETAPWVANRLNLIIDRKISEFMSKEVNTVKPDTPLREAIRIIVKHGSPIPVVEKDRLVGLISSQTVVNAVMTIAKNMKEEGAAA